MHRPPVLLAALLTAALTPFALAACGPDAFDTDGDGTVDSQDCAPDDASIHPDAADPWGDGIDQNCDDCDDVEAGDGYDIDCDGYPANDDLPADQADRYDCNDNDASIHPDALDLPNDGVDQDCFEGDCVDQDGDGFCSGVDDCDDSAATVFLGAPELPDCLDHDCDGTASEGTAAADDDGDGSCEGIDLGGGLQCCEPDEEPGDCDDDAAAANLHDLDGDGVDTCGEDGLAGSGDEDCDDGDDDRSPELSEVCDGKDNDCVGGVPADEIDDDGDGRTDCEGDCDDTDGAMHDLDVDQDGFSPCQEDCDDGDPLMWPVDSDGDGVSSCDGDCAPLDPTILPGAVEVCDGLDGDCDGLLPPDEVDGDGDGDPACADCDDTDPAVTGIDEDGDTWQACDGDCNDANPAINPDATDVVDTGVDQNCDGVDGTDVDQDGWASIPSGGDDCDDADPTVNPADGDGDGQSGCDGDCDDADPALSSADADGDSVSTCDGDCDDADPAVSPLATDTAGDGIDQDCDGVDGDDADGDGFASVASAGQDCDDADPAINPAAADTVGDGIDQNCDGVDGDDADGDGFASVASAGDDCDDADPAVYPHATEIPGDGQDDNCDGLDLCEDLNCDGWTDLVFTNNYDGSSYFQDSYIYWGSATGFSPANRGTFPTVGGAEVQIADLDGDGYLDLAVANQQSSALVWEIDSYIYWGSAAGYSTLDRTPLPTTGGTGVRTVDLDGDDYLDIVFSSYWDTTTVLVDSWIYWGSPAGYSTLDRTGLPTQGSWGMDVADVDDDGSLDIVFANFRNQTSTAVDSWIYWGTAGAYSTSDRLGLATDGAYGTKVADLDDDGWNDVIITQFWDLATFDKTAVIYWGSVGGFTSTTHLPVSGGTGLSPADLDGDGDLDLLLSCERTDGPIYSIPSYIYWNDGGSFDPADRQELEAYGPVVNLVEDLDGDGTPDIVLANWYDDVTHDRDSFIYWGASGVYSAADRTGLPTIGGAGAAAAGPGIAVPRTVP